MNNLDLLTSNLENKGEYLLKTVKDVKYSLIVDEKSYLSSEAFEGHFQVSSFELEVNKLARFELPSEDDLQNTFTLGVLSEIKKL